MASCQTSLGTIADGVVGFKCGSGFVPVNLSGLTLNYDVGTGSYTLAAISLPITWQTVTSTTQQLAPQNGYINASATLCSYALPSTATVGQVIYIDGRGPGGWKITQAAGQSIEYGNIITTIGVTGTMGSQFPSDVIKLRCVVANTTWKVEYASILLWS